MPPSPVAPITDFLPELDSLIADAMDEWKIPGLAIAIVQNGATPQLKAYGQRDVEAALPVTTDTQFTICSITKTFTSIGLAMLGDERLLDWTRPVCDYIPEFRLQDAVATERITVRDLLCHHSGLPRHDWVWMPGDTSRADMLAAMRYLEPSRDVRSVYQYNNLGYLVAGTVAERVTGQSWEEFTRKRLTNKLRMDVTFSPEEMATVVDAAFPYAMDGDRRLRAERWPIRTVSGGGINTSISGLANWMRFLLDNGEFEGERLLSAHFLRELQTPLVHVLTSEFSEIGDTHYGLGFMYHHYRGERVLNHGGGWIGWGTLMTLVPDRGIGIAVFTNRDPSAVPDILTYFVIDRLCGKPPVDWFDRFRDRRRAMLKQMEVDQQTRRAVRRTGTRPSHDLAEYAGDYAHAGYGRITITLSGDGLLWKYRRMSSPLTHRHYDTFELPKGLERLLPNGLAMTFATDREGNVTSLSVPFEPMVKDIMFERVASGDCMDPAFRKACTGTYGQGQIVQVVGQDRDGQLTLTPTNQPTYNLLPFRDSTFTIMELAGFRVEFRRGANGTIAEAILHQPNGTFLAQRMST